MMSKRFMKSVFGRFSKEYTCKKEEYETPKKSLTKKRKNIPRLPSWSYWSRSLVKNPDTIRAQSLVLSLV